MEKALFDWDDWDYADREYLTFYHPVLKVQIGKFPPGTKFDAANMDCLEMKLTFINFGDPEFDTNNNTYRPSTEKHSFHVKLVVED
jgi:hypothetical protein